MSIANTLSNNDNNDLRFFDKTDHPIPTRKLDLLVIKKKWICQLKNFIVLVNYRVKRNQKTR